MEQQQKHRPKLIVLACVLVGLLSASALSYFAYESQKEYIDGNVLNLPYMNSWNDEDLLDNPWKTSQFYVGLMYRNLFLADSSFQFVSMDLAEGYQVSLDGLEYQITLKEDALWSDGEALTVDDVIFSIQGVLQSKTANGIYTTAFSKIVGYDAFIADPSVGLAGLERVSDYAIIIHLESQHPTMAQVLAQFVILPEHALADADMANIDVDSYWKDPVVSGMYQVGDVVSYETVQLVKNSYYSGTEPEIDEIILYINYKFANLDYYSTNNITEIINYRSMRSMEEHKVDLLFYRYFVYNIQGIDGNENPAMQDAAVREAIALAIDRESLLYDIYLDSGTLVDSGVPRTNDAYDGIELAYNPERAMELLAASDYDVSRPLRLAYYYTDTTSKSFLEAVAEDLEAVGFTVELCYLATSEELYTDREYDMLLKGLSAFDVSEWYFEYTSANANLSDLFGGETVFDELVGELSTTVDATYRNELLQELQALEHEMFYKVPLFTLSQVVYINEDRVDLPDGCTFGNTWYKYDMDFESWSIKKE